VRSPRKIRSATANYGPGSAWPLGHRISSRTDVRVRAVAFESFDRSSVRAEADYRGSLSTLWAELSEPTRMRDQSKSGRNGRLIRHSPDVLVQQECYERLLGHSTLMRVIGHLSHICMPRFCWSASGTKFLHNSYRSDDSIGSFQSVQD